MYIHQNLKEKNKFVRGSSSTSGMIFLVKMALPKVKISGLSGRSPFTPSVIERLSLRSVVFSSSSISLIILCFIDYFSSVPNWARSFFKLKKKELFRIQDGADRNDQNVEIRQSTLGFSNPRRHRFCRSTCRSKSIYIFHHLFKNKLWLSMINISDVI